MAEDAAIATLGSTYGYSDQELGAMPFWLVAVRLGLDRASEGYPRGSREVMSKGDIRRQQEAQDKKPGKMGRGKPSAWKPRLTDPGSLHVGDAAR